MQHMTSQQSYEMHSAIFKRLLRMLREEATSVLMDADGLKGPGEDHLDIYREAIKLAKKAGV